MDNNNKLKETLENDINFTSKNYANMYERLLFRDNTSKFFIVYYSIIAIVNAILPKYIKHITYKSYIFDFSSVIISIILLVSSLSVSIANYSERKSKAMIALDKLKRMKKDIAIYSGDSLEKNECELFKKITQNYHEIVDNMELRTEYDYYKTCKKLGVERERFTLVETLKVWLLHFAEILIYFMLVILPIFFYAHMLK